MIQIVTAAWRAFQSCQYHSCVLSGMVGCWLDFVLSPISAADHKRKSRTTIPISVKRPKAEVARVRVYAISSRLGFNSFTKALTYCDAARASCVYHRHEFEDIWEMSGQLMRRGNQRSLRYAVINFYRQTGKHRMMDYHGFWQGFISLFGVLPVVVGTIVGMLWAWRNGRRGAKLIPPAFLGGAALGLFVFFGAVLFFRA